MRVHVIEAEPRCAHVELEAVARQAPHMRLLRLRRAFDRRHIPLRHPDDHRHVVFRERLADAGAAAHLHVEAFGPVVDRDLEVARQVGHGVRHDPHTQLLAVIPADHARVDRPAVDVEMLAAVDVVVRGAFIPVFAARRARVRVVDAEQGVDAHREDVGECDEAFEFRPSGAAFPFGDGLPRDADAARELFLRERGLRTQVLEACGEFHCARLGCGCLFVHGGLLFGDELVGADGADRGGEA